MYSYTHTYMCKLCSSKLSQKPEKRKPKIADLFYLTPFFPGTQQWIWREGRSGFGGKEGLDLEGRKVWIWREERSGFGGKEGLDLEGTSPKRNEIKWRKLFNEIHGEKIKIL